MKIAVITQHMLCFGGVRRWLELGNEFVKRGHDYTIYVERMEYGPDWFDYNGKIKKKQKIDFKKLDADVLMVGNALHFGNLLEFSGLKVLYLIGAGRVYGKKYARVIDKVDLVIGNNHWWKEIYPQAEIVVGGINTDFFKPLDIKKIKNSILFYGRWDSRHLQTQKLYDQILSIHIDKETYLISFDTKKYGAHNVLEINGSNQDNLREAYNRATLFVSIMEVSGINNVVLEAMACGCPVVTNGVGVEKIAIDRKTALVANGNELRGVIEELLNNESLRKELAGNALKEVQRYSWQIVVNKLEKLFYEKIKT